ncbi:hypothetical protein Psed_0186 [Pseudonocardia dioxanivorans CB1190]|uniref:Glycosyltransferase RgtA/B/C/D-like domain-containing protein n=1 Tax=Pseudonocardia dioxanivorans (strain ATCC 55486 / DSM 44775 / JCM 13855 / CB1190) TaxID=675635 RepID=F4CKB4_PSEUX|nr:hypothetical protein [Pseudonocardia dioxanivorans]AEA22461.1 hypothetical protein Psed_0186 [Pseudonocardia dioxanivorans CB1190]
MTDTAEVAARPQEAEPDPDARPPRSGRRVWWGVPAVLLPTVLFGLHALVYGRWEVDDAGITFAYARSVATGAGPVLQAGLPPVEGWSNPAWLGLLVVGHWLRLFDHGAWFGVPDYVAYPKALALLCVAGVFAGFWAAASAVSRRPVVVTVVAGTIAAAIPSFVIWCVSGLENSLLALAVTWIGAVLVRAAARGRVAAAFPAVGCGLLAALAALTRPEGLIYGAAFPLVALLLVRRGAVARTLGAGVLSVVAFLVPVGLYLWWRWATFGQLLPTTAVAKSQGLPTVAGFGKVTELVSYAGWLGVLVGAVVVGAALLRPTPVRTAVVVLLVPLGLGIVAFGVLVPDWMEQYRFATPVWALGALVVTLAAVDVLGGLRARGRAVVAVVVAGAAVLSGVGWVGAAQSFRAAPTAPMCLIVVNTGWEFNGYADILGLRSATFFAPEIGGGALAGRSLLVDGAGLAEPTIARLWAAKDWAGVRDYVLDDVRPTFFRAHGEFRTQMDFDDDPRFQADYVLIGPAPNGGGNWVRRDLVRDEATMDRLRAWAARAAADDTAQRATPRASCGDRIVQGETAAS